jgi:hypothetical protein
VSTQLKKITTHEEREREENENCFSFLDRSGALLYIVPMSQRGTYFTTPDEDVGLQAIITKLQTT